MTDLKGDDYERAFYRDWEAGKVKDGNGKRVMPQPEPNLQETIAKWIKANTEHRQWYICPKCSYQAPRFRDKWVGLTDEETNTLVRKWAGELVFEVEQALKEKNT
jgi:hypothetical protein